MKNAKMPKAVKVGAHTYSVVRPKSPKDGDTEVDGLCEDYELRLTVRSGLKRSRAQETAIHELLHTCTDGTDVAIDIEEKLVGMIAPKLLQIIKDNPELMEYLRS